MKKFFSVLMLVLLFALCALPFAQSAEAACTQALATSAKGNWLSGLYQNGDVYKIAFYTDTATWGAATEQYSATNEVSGTNYVAGGFTLDTLSYGTSGTTYWLDWADEVNNNTTFTAPSTCVIIYDDTAANTSCAATDNPWPCCTGAAAGTCADAIIGVWTFASVQPSAGTITVTFPTPDATNAIVRIAFYDWLELLMAQLQLPGPLGVAWHRDATVSLSGVTAAPAQGRF